MDWCDLCSSMHVLVYDILRTRIVFFLFYVKTTTAIVHTKHKVFELIKQKREKLTSTVLDDDMACGVLAVANETVCPTFHRAERQKRAVVAGPPPPIPPSPAFGALRIPPAAVLPRATVPSRRNIWCRLLADSNNADKCEREGAEMDRAATGRGQTLRKMVGQINGELRVAVYLLWNGRSANSDACTPYTLPAPLLHLSQEVGCRPASFLPTFKIDRCIYCWGDLGDIKTPGPSTDKQRPGNDVWERSLVGNTVANCWC